MNTYARIRSNRRTTQVTAIGLLGLVVALVIGGFDVDPTVSPFAPLAALAALSLPSVFALLSLRQRPTLLPVASLAAVFATLLQPILAPAWLLAAYLWWRADRNRVRAAGQPFGAGWKRPLLAATVVLPLLALGVHDDPSCIDPAGNRVADGASGWSISMTSTSSTTEGRTCASDAILGTEVAASLLAAGLVTEAARRWPKATLQPEPAAVAQ
ncbi:MAG: hypothetical protein OEX04_04465 [Acidimicrobiia bacterium]|nr:hypothetical protein [Acidimicrobiia bacterium]